MAPCLKFGTTKGVPSFPISSPCPSLYFPSPSGPSLCSVVSFSISSPSIRSRSLIQLVGLGKHSSNAVSSAMSAAWLKSILMYFSHET